MDKQEYGNLIAVNRRTNEKWMYTELSKAFFGRMKMVKFYRIIFIFFALSVAGYTVYYASSGKTEYIAILIAATVAILGFLLLTYMKPKIEGQKAFLQALLANGENAVMESRVYENAIEYVFDDERIPLPLTKIVSVLETENLFEIELKDDDNTTVGHMLLKDGFTVGTLEDVKSVLSRYGK